MGISNSRLCDEVYFSVPIDTGRENGRFRKPEGIEEVR